MNVPANQEHHWPCKADGWGGSEREGTDKPGCKAGGEGHSLESPARGNSHTGFGGGREETYWQTSHAPCAYPTGLFRGFGDDGMPLAHVLDPHEPYSGQQEGT
jgi:hypothetical protein